MASWREKKFAATNKEGTCLWCGVRLAWWIGADEPEQGRGYGGKGHFCSARCAFNFAEAWAELGKRFVPSDKEET